jgi:hypothetical protein
MVRIAAWQTPALPAMPAYPAPAANAERTSHREAEDAESQHETAHRERGFRRDRPFSELKLRTNDEEDQDEPNQEPGRLERVERQKRRPENAETVEPWIRRLLSASQEQPTAIGEGESTTIHGGSWNLPFVGNARRRRIVVQAANATNKTAKMPSRNSRWESGESNVIESDPAADVSVGRRTTNKNTKMNAVAMPERIAPKPANGRNTNAVTRSRSSINFQNASTVSESRCFSSMDDAPQFE